MITIKARSRLSIVGEGMELFPQRIKFKFYPRNPADGLDDSNSYNTASYMPEFAELRLNLPGWLCDELRIGQ